MEAFFKMIILTLKKRRKTHMKYFIYYSIAVMLISFNIREIAFDKSGVFFNLNSLSAKQSKDREVFAYTPKKTTLPTIVFEAPKKQIPEAKKVSLKQENQLPATVIPVELKKPEPVKMEKSVNLENSVKLVKIEKPVKIENSVKAAKTEEPKIALAVEKEKSPPIKIPEIKKAEINQNATTSNYTYSYGKKKFKPHKYWKQHKKGRR